ncbi:acyl-ACP--UDP-N-acetylglucosamine O-acyltransferase [Methyloligella solikamskensis]|uniref:Acyl-[acyl-carrier-protein]--UDP-N-acetylglucosamine O-acyltransferase n=1 Tax=Methyloligella solikamskensis TaxID=1177756 RepID=A0ABW3J9W4_9HYPH
MANIHATAVVDAGATLGSDVTVGPFCVVGPKVTLGDEVTLQSHVVVSGKTTIGKGSTVFPFASLGEPPQDTKYKDQDTELIIGEHAIIREHVTIHVGSVGDDQKTVIGDHCMFMVGAHVAHNCKIGNNVLMVNNATLGGHVRLSDNVIIGGLSAIHQFVRVGEGAMIGGMTGITADLIPFGMAIGDRAALSGLNIVGLKRKGVPREEIHQLRQAYRMLFGPEGNLTERCNAVQEAFGENPRVKKILDFIRSDTDRQFLIPHHGGSHG